MKWSKATDFFLLVKLVFIKDICWKNQMAKLSNNDQRSSKNRNRAQTFSLDLNWRVKLKIDICIFFCCFLDTVQWSLFNLFKNSRCLMFYLKIFFVIIYNCDKKNKIKLFVITTCFCCFLSARQAEITINAWYEILMIKWLTETHVRLAHTDVFASSAKNIANLISTIYYLYF